MDTIEVEIDRELPVRFVCSKSGETLGRRYVVPPLYDESEFQDRGTSAWQVVEDRLRSENGNETVDLDWVAPVGVTAPAVLGLTGVKAPRTGAMLWRAEYGPNGVRVHIACGCTYSVTRLLDHLVTEALEAAESPEPLVEL